MATTEFLDTGIILNVTPRVNAGGLVTLEIEQEVSTPGPRPDPTVAPAIRQRRIQSTVAVQSGQTLALGGLIRDSKSVGKTGVPFLMDIPLLGALFRETSTDSGRTELLVLITPRVVRNQSEARAVTSELKQRLRQVAPLQRRIE